MLFFRHRVQFLLLTPVFVACLAFLSFVGYHLVDEMDGGQGGAEVVLANMLGVLVLLGVGALFGVGIVRDGISRRGGRVHLEEWTSPEDLEYVTFAEAGRDNWIPMPYLFPVVGLRAAAADEGETTTRTYAKRRGSWGVTTGANEVPLPLVGDYRLVPGAERRTRRRSRRLAAWLGVAYREPSLTGRAPRRLGVAPGQVGEIPGPEVWERPRWRWPVAWLATAASVWWLTPWLCLAVTKTLRLPTWAHGVDPQFWLIAALPVAPVAVACLVAARRCDGELRDLVGSGRRAVGFLFLVVVPLAWVVAVLAGRPYASFPMEDGLRGLWTEHADVIVAATGAGGVSVLILLVGTAAAVALSRPRPAGGRPRTAAILAVAGVLVVAVAAAGVVGTARGLLYLDDPLQVRRLL